MIELAGRVSLVQPSLTLRVSAKAQELRRQGRSIVAFGVGEPDFDTPAHIKAAVQEALAKGCGKYTAVSGTPELRAAVAAEMNRIHGTSYGPENVIVSVGAKHSLFNLFQAVVNPGDEVIIPTPCWVSYPEMISFMGGKSVFLPTEAAKNYQFSQAELRACVTPRSKLLVLNSPCNPTGAVYEESLLRDVIQVMRDTPALWLVMDDIYRSLTYGKAWLSICKLAPDIANRVLLIDGVSKAYAMTGWRIGYLTGPKQLVTAMDMIQGQSTTNPAAASQAAALAALTGPQDCVEEMRVEFDRRRRVMLEKLNQIPGVACVEPHGAFYCFADFRKVMGSRFADDVAFAEWLLDKAGVAIVPGSGFFAPGFMRLSYATSMEQIEEGLSRLAGAVAEIA